MKSLEQAKKRCVIVIKKSKDYPSAMGELLVRKNKLIKRVKQCSQQHEYDSAEIFEINDILNKYQKP